MLATASGVLQPGNLENVNFTISGQVAVINVNVNAKVAAGQQLAKLNDSSQQAEVNAANSAVSAAQAAIAQAQVKRVQRAGCPSQSATGSSDGRPHQSQRG